MLTKRCLSKIAQVDVLYCPFSESRGANAFARTNGAGTLQYRRAPYGDLEILQGLAVAGIFGVNSTESEGEQTGIIREQIPSSSRAVMIFRGPLELIAGLVRFADLPSGC